MPSAPSYMSVLPDRLRAAIREVPGFPKPGINFKDISPLLLDPALVFAAGAALAEPFRQAGITRVVGIESRGFLWGPLIAQQLDCGFVIVRKKGKLPPDTHAVSYDLEYGSATLEIHQTALGPTDRVLVHDDLLATGGTAAAAASLAQRIGAQVVGYSFLIELEFLGGRSALQPHGGSVHALLGYSS